MLPIVGLNTNLRPNPMNALTNTPEYLAFLDEVQSSIRRSRLLAVRSVNRELIQLYWELGALIVSRQEKLGWGKAVVEQLALDLKETLEGRGGFSAQNLWYMRQFYLAYRDHEFLQQLVGEIPWGQNITIMSKVKDIPARQYYLSQTIEMGWSRNVLLHQIKSQAYERQHLAPPQHNFQSALPSHLAEQADELIKDTYVLDMIGIEKPLLEREIEDAMVKEIRKVLLELGYGFAFIGNQYRLQAGGQEYFIDLLFSHRKLNCLVAIELKIGKFKPEHAGKMNFYLNLLDDFVKEDHENPSIGIILCTERDSFTVEYALRGLTKPMGVSEYTHTLPSDLADKLPDQKTLQERLRMS